MMNWPDSNELYRYGTCRGESGPGTARLGAAGSGKTGSDKVNLDKASPNTAGTKMPTFGRSPAVRAVLSRLSALRRFGRIVRVGRISRARYAKCVAALLLSLCLTAWGWGFMFTLPAAASGTPDTAAYVGSPACAACHEAVYERFSRQSKKARTRIMVEKMQPKLSPEEQKTCFKCHATGYGQLGGFVSYAQTPDLGDIGCEACHGPGSRHIENGNPEYIRRKVPVEHCYSCHTPERNRRGNFTPLPYGAAH